MPVHLHTSSNKKPQAGDPPNNWGTAPLHVVNGRWLTSGTMNSFFAGGYHDSWNRGAPFPVSAGGSGEPLSTYRTDSKYFPFARQSWLGGVIQLKYKVQWNSSTRSFVSLEAKDSVDPDDGYSAADVRKFVILDIDHRLKYLSAERAELTFGFAYDGLPSINLTNFVVNQIDDQFGVFKAVTDAGLDAAFNQLNSAVDDLALVLNDHVRGFYERFLVPPIDMVVDDVYVHLHQEWNNAASLWRQFGSPPDLSTVLGQRLMNDVFAKLNAAQNQLGQLQELIDILAQVEAGLNTLNNSLLAEHPGTGQLQAMRNLSRELVKILSDQIGGNLGTILIGSGIDERLNELLDPLLTDVKPQVAQIRLVIAELAQVVGQIKGTLNGVVSTDFSGHLQSIYTNAISGVDSELEQIRTRIENHLYAQLAQFGPHANFLARDPEEVRTMMRTAVLDFLLDSLMIEQMQVAVKQRLQDVEISIRQGLDNAFAQVNTVVKDAVSSYLSQIDDGINGILGDFSDKLGSGSIQGYAVFNGNALRKVRLDGKFELKIPDETSLQAFLEINQYTSNDLPPGCTPLAPGETLTEVIIGALDVKCNFLAPDMRVNISGKFSMKSGPGPWSIRPNGMGGEFSVNGEVNFEAFTLTNLAVGMMFGANENYLTAALGMRFGSYGAKGGIFLGRTCTLDPILLWDPLVASALGTPNPSFTGGYAYGEAHIPVSEVLLGIPATCMFKITADVGAGFFYFVEGPTYGARLGLGVGGEILCLVSIKGRVDLVGARVGSETRVKGKGTVRGEIGPCNFCVKIRRTMEIESTIAANGTMSGKGGAR